MPVAEEEKLDDIDLESGDEKEKPEEDDKKPAEETEEDKVPKMKQPWYQFNFLSSAPSFMKRSSTIEKKVNMTYCRILSL